MTRSLSTSMRVPALRRTAVHLCSGDEATADDLLQNTLIRTYQAWAQVRNEDARDAYVRRIMVRLSYRRERRAVPGLYAPSEEGSVEQHLVERHTVWAYLATLPPRQRAVMVLRYYEGLSEREIAEVMGCSTGSIKTHASRGPLLDELIRLGSDPNCPNFSFVIHVPTSSVVA